MSERNVGVPWSTYEDSLLTQAIALYGESDNWKTIALHVPGRTNKACRKRWLHSLSPSVKKTAWTAEEDKKLLELYAVYHTKWAQIAREIPGRTDDACSKRYREALDPSLKKDEWTPGEDVQLTELHEQFGGKWGHIGHELHRSGLGCRNRWRLLQRKKVTSSVEPPPVINFPSHTDPRIPSEWQMQQASWPDPGPLYLHSPDLGDLPLQSEAAVCPPPPPAPYNWTPFDFNQPSPHPYCDAQFSNTTVTSSLPNSPHFNVPIQLTFPIPNDHVVDEIHATPHMTPTFRFSSSSLSAALSDPLPSRPLPPVAPTTANVFSDSNHYLPTEHIPPSFDHQDTPPRSTKPSNFALPSAVDEACLNRDIQAQNEYPMQRVGPVDSLLFDQPRTLLVVPAPPIDDRMSQEFPNLGRETAGVNHNSCDSLDLAQPSFPPPNDPPPSSYDGSLPSTPLGFARLKLSTPPSPAGGTASTLASPASTRLPLESMLYSPYHRSIPSTNTQTRRRSDRPRLDSALPATHDRSVKPYACGYDRCWPSDALTSYSCFATSKELSDHSKQNHAEGPACDKPFRCGLEGCGKSWKSINGLQYHLQISKSHFQHALSSRFSSKQPQDEVGSPVSSPPPPPPSPLLVPPSVEQPRPNPKPELPKKKRTYPCSREGCYNVYRQLGGLRYHLTHGHPEDLPAQLEIVPPTLARKVEEKLRSKAPDPVA